MKKLVTTLFFVYFSSALFAQKEANIWYFGGYAGLDFNTSPPTPLTDSNLYTIEGCATISDTNGDLLFYTDGSEVWDKTHEKMFNGLGLLGHRSSTQSAIIVPNPVYEDLFYIFTVDESGYENGLHYTKIDMSLNGGLGDVDTSEKNIHLVSPIAEKINAVKSADGSSIFVFSYREGIFYTFEVTETGVNPTPIQTISGLFVENLEGRGYLKVSPDGDHIAIAHEEDQKVFIYDLDIETGIISNELELHLDDPSHPNNSTDTYPYGVEFSPGSSLLYITSSTKDNTTNPSLNKSYLWQFDLNNASPENSALLIDYHTHMYRGALQLAPDFKIYHALSRTFSVGLNKLSVIDNPDIRGTSCNYNYASVDLGGKSSKQGLPPFIQSFFDVFILAENACIGNSIDFSIADTTGITNITWDFGDGTPTITGIFTPSHTYSSPGNYIVIVTVSSSAGPEVRKKHIKIFDPDVDDLDDVIACDSYNLPPLSSGHFYTGTIGSGSILPEGYEITTSQTIYIFDESGTTPNCFDEENFIVTIQDSPIAELRADVTAKNVYTLPPLIEGGYYTEPNALGTQLFEGDEIKETQTIYIFVEIGISPNNCFDESSFIINIDLDIEYMPFFTPNGNGENDYWNVLNASMVKPGSLINIFNRYGKILAKIDPKTRGWDGTYKGNSLPSSEYWFVVQLKDGTQQKGSFSLIRK